MRLLVAMVMFLGACRIPMSASYGLDGPHVAKDGISLLFVPTESNGPHEVHVAYVQLTEVLLAALRSDPRVHVEVADHLPTELHALDRFDYVVELGVFADANQSVQCVIEDPRAALDQLFFDRLAHSHGCAVQATSPWVAQAVVAIGFDNPRAKHERLNRTLSHAFVARQKDSQDWQPLLDARVAEATTWMQTRLPHHFSAEVAIVTSSDHTAVPVGERDGVREGDVFDVYDGKAPDGMARASYVDASSTELERVYGGGAFVAGARAVQRGRVWLLELDPTIGVHAMTATHGGTSSTSPEPTLGFRTRAHPVGSGLVLGAGLEGILGAHKGLLIGPEVGWEQWVAPHLQLHVIADGHFIAGAFDGMTDLGVGTAGVVGGTVATRHAYVSLEGGYAWTNRLHASTDTFDFRGPFARLTVGLSGL